MILNDSDVALVGSEAIGPQRFRVRDVCGRRGGGPRVSQVARDMRSPGNSNYKQGIM